MALLEGRVGATRREKPELANCQTCKASENRAVFPNCYPEMPKFRMLARHR
jgi:hypothetical protein